MKSLHVGNSRRQRKRSHQSRLLRTRRAQQRAEKRLRHLQTAKASNDLRVGATDARIQCLQDPDWVARYIQSELQNAQNARERLHTDSQNLGAEIAGLQIEIARLRKALKNSEAAESAAA